MTPVNHTTTRFDLDVRDCGLADYRKVLQLQLDLHRQRRLDEVPNTVLICEHLPVVTFGARDDGNKLLVDTAMLARMSIDLVKVRRGGGVTAHNPGQIVFYPILKLSELKLSIRGYIQTLEEIGLELLARLGLPTERKMGFPGLWVGSKKIASIGVRVSRQTTYHGMAVNICNELSIFDLLVPCGLDGVEMTSVLKETGRMYDISRVKLMLNELLVHYFGR